MGGLHAVAVREGDAQASVAGESGGEGIVGGGAGGEVHDGGAVLAGRALDEGEQRGGEYLVGGSSGETYSSVSATPGWLKSMPVLPSISAYPGRS